MEKRIELEKRGKNPADIKELNLDNCRSTSIVGLSDEFCNLQSLSLSNVGLTSLKGFPKLPNLKKLELSDNRINNGLNLLETSPKLTHLNLSGNRIKDLATLEPLKNFKFLKILDLFNNEATMTEMFRDKVFKMLPTLKYLDGFDVKDCDVDDSDGDSDGDEEVNGNDDDSDEESGSDDSNLEVALGAVYSENLDDLSDESDYEAWEEAEDEECIEEEDINEEEDDDDAQSPNVSRGKKRKHEDGEATN